MPTLTTPDPGREVSDSLPQPSIDKPGSTSQPSVTALRWMIFVAAVAMVGTLPGRTHGLGLITEGLLADLNLDRSAYARVNLVATLIGSLFCWPCGWLLDRLGIRLTGATVLLLLGVSTLGIAMTTTTALLWVWITLTRGFGQSMLSVVSITLCGKASLGLKQAVAMAGYSLLVSVLFMTAFKLMGLAIPSLGWRASWSGLGWLVTLAGPLFALVVIEPNRWRSADDDQSSPGVNSATMKQALSSPAFWVFALASSLYALVSSGLSLFNQSILSERGFDASVFYSLLLISTFSGLLGNLVTGWLARHFTYGKLMAMTMSIYTLALVLFPFVEQLYQVYAYGVALGLCGGGVTVVFFGVWSHAFGREHLGKIQGLAQASTVVASALGPMAFAECLRISGSYLPAFLLLAPCVGCLAIAAWLVTTPRALSGCWSA